MKSYYSIIYSRISAIRNERLNLGLIALNETGKVFYEYSREKEAVVHTETQIEIKKTQFLESVKEKVNINYELKPEQFDFLIVPAKVDMIGKNENPVLNQFIDFNITPALLENTIGRYLSLIKPFELKYAGDGKFFIIGDEPDPEKKTQHLIWEHLWKSELRKQKIVEVYSSDESDAVREYIDTHDVKPFFSDNLK